MCKMSGRRIIFTFSRRDAFGIFVTILSAKDSYVYMAFRSLLKVCFLCRHLGSWHLFKDKRDEKTSEQCIGANIIVQLSSLLGKLSLDTADKHSNVVHNSKFYILNYPVNLCSQLILVGHNLFYPCIQFHDIHRLTGVLGHAVF